MPAQVRDGARRMKESKTTSTLLATSRVVDVLVFACVVAGIFLLFDRLAWNGSTWDERTDFHISRAILLQRSLVANVSDPSQSRLPHVLGALGLHLGGTSIEAFKSPFALTGLATGLLLFAFLSRRRSTLVALYGVAFFLTNPWVLSSSRTAATGGDVLVMGTTFGFLWGAIRICELGKGGSVTALAGTALFGLIGGLGVGAKLTNAALLPPGLLLVAVMRRSIVHVAVFGALALGASLATHPLLVTHSEAVLADLTEAWNNLRRPPHFKVSTPHEVAQPRAVPAGVADGHPSPTPEIVPVSLETPPKWRYLGYTLVGKLTLPFLCFVVAGIAMGTVTAVRSRRIDPAFWGALAFVLAPCVVLVWKSWVNVNYFLPVVLPAITLATIPLSEMLTPAFPVRRLVASLAWLGLLAFQLSIDERLAPDFPQSGRRLGEAAQGLMSGPAVNHCQGGPLVIDRLNRLHREDPSFTIVRVFESCLPVLEHDARFGPVTPDGYRFTRYLPRAMPRLAHILVAHDTTRYFKYGRPQHRKRQRDLRVAIKGCHRVETASPDDRFKIYRCPDRH